MGDQIASLIYLADTLHEHFDDWDFYVDDVMPNGRTSWIQKNGKAIKRYRMSKRHIINAMRMLTRTTHNTKKATAWIRLFEDELNRRIKKACKR